MQPLHEAFALRVIVCSRLLYCVPVVLWRRVSNDNRFSLRRVIVLVIFPRDLLDYFTWLLSFAFSFLRLREEKYVVLVCVNSFSLKNHFMIDGMGCRMMRKFGRIRNY
jgi:hypothetical protein